MKREPRKIKLDVELNEEWKKFINAIKISDSQDMQKIAKIVENFEYDRFAHNENCKRFFGNFSFEDADKKIVDVICVYFKTRQKEKTLAIITKDEGVKFLVTLCDKVGTLKCKQENEEKFNFEYKNRRIHNFQKEIKKPQEKTEIDFLIEKSKEL